MLSTVGFSANCLLSCHERMPPSYFVLSHVSVSSCSSLNWVPHSKLKYILRVSSSEGLPNELVEDSKFVPLNAEDPRYGPPALLLLGFEADEVLKIQQLLKELDGEFLKVISCFLSSYPNFIGKARKINGVYFQVIYCTEDMLTCSLWEAMHKTQCSLEEVKIDKSLPRICFLSGLSGEEMMMFIDAFPETGLKPAAFAALVPNSANKPLQELIEEIMGDHEMLTGEQL